MAEVEEVDAQTEPKRGIVFELENLAFSGREAVYGALQSELKKKGVDLSQFAYSRHCLTASLSRSVAALLGGTGEKKLQSASAIDHAVGTSRKALAALSEPNAEVVALLKKAQKEGFVLGAVSQLEESAAHSLVSSLGLAEDGFHVLSCSPDECHCPSANDLLRLAREMGVRPSLCTVVASGAMSTRSALSSCMRCFAVPDRFTECEDFSGADEIADALDAAAQKSLLALVASR